MHNVRAYTFDFCRSSSSCCRCVQSNCLVTFQTLIKPQILHIKLEIWGKAQRESAWRPKSDWGN